MRSSAAGLVLALACLAPGGTYGAGPAGAGESAQDSLVARGRRTFDAVCSACHSVQPPARQAPPMANIAHRYRVMTHSRAELVERVAAWVPEPSAERSLMPPQALDHWDLMPALPLPADELRAVGHYVAFLAFDTATSGRGMGMGMGMGGRGRHMTRDTTEHRR